MSDENNGMAIVCGNCQSWEHRHYCILWVNQNGAKLRIFCRDCGYTTDKKRLGNTITVKVSKTAWKWGTPRTNPIGWTQGQVTLK